MSDPPHRIIDATISLFDYVALVAKHSPKKVTQSDWFIEIADELKQTFVGMTIAKEYEYPLDDHFKIIYDEELSDVTGNSNNVGDDKAGENGKDGELRKDEGDAKSKKFDAIIDRYADSLVQRMKQDVTVTDDYNSSAVGDIIRRIPDTIRKIDPTIDSRYFEWIITSYIEGGIKFSDFENVEWWLSIYECVVREHQLRRKDMIEDVCGLYGSSSRVKMGLIDYLQESQYEDTKTRSFERTSSKEPEKELNYKLNHKIKQFFSFIKILL